MFWNMNHPNCLIGVLRDALKILSDRQKKDKVELLTTVKQEIQASANKGDESLVDDVYMLKHDILEQLSKPQHGKVTHDLTTNTWWLVGVGIVIFFLIIFFTVQVYYRLHLSNSQSLFSIVNLILVKHLL